MAATVTGIFRIIDKASAPMKKMERQAKQLDKALMSTGDSMDSIGGSKQLKQFDETSKKLDSMTVSTKNTNRTFSDTSSKVTKLGKDTDNLTSKLGKLGAAFNGVQKIIGVLKLPALGAAIGLLVQGVSALAGGVVSLLPKLQDLLGVVGAAPAAFLTMGLAMGTVKIAFSGMSAAIKGTKGAMDKLTPSAQRFAKEIRALKPIQKELAASAQAGLFPGLNAALKNVTSNRAIGTAKKLLGGMGQSLGNVAERASKSFTTPAFLKDLERLGTQADGLMQRLGNSLIAVSHALVNVAIAARPFTNWLASTIEGWAKWTESASAAGRATGGLRAYFERTRGSLETFGHIAANLWATFEGIMKAARPLGDSLYESAEKGTKAWAEFANSVTGQRSMAKYFEDIKPNIEATFELAGKIAGVLIRMGTSSTFAGVVKTLTKAVEPLGEVVELLVQEFGPVLAETVSQLVLLFKNLENGESVFRNLVEVFDKFLGVVNRLLELVPGLSNLFIGVLGAVALTKVAGRLRGIAGEWGLIATNASAAAVAQGEAAAAAATGGAIGGGVYGRRTPRPPGGQLSPAAGAGTLVLPAGAAAAEKEAAASKGLLGRARGILPGSAAEAGTMASSGLAAAGKFFLPIAAFTGGATALTTPGNWEDKLQGGVSGLTMGFVPPPRSDQEDQLKGYQTGRENFHKTLLNPNWRYDESNGVQQNIYNSLGLGGGVEKRQNPLRTARRALNALNPYSERSEEEKGEGSYFKRYIAAQHMAKREREARKKAEAGAKTAYKVGKGGELASGFASGFATNVKQGVNPVDAFSSTTPKVLADIQHLGTKGGSVLAANYLHWAAIAKKENPKLQKPFEDLVAGVEKTFGGLGRKVEVVNGRVVEGTSAELSKWAGIIQTKFSEGVQSGTKLMEALKNEALRTLKLMGFSPGESQMVLHESLTGTQGNSQKKANVSAHNHGGAATTLNTGPKHAGGGRIGGKGTRDTVPLVMGMAAPGELIVNGWTENDVNLDLAAAGKPTLAQRVEREHRRHSDLASTGTEGPILPGFALGGRAGIAASRKKRGSGGAPAAASGTGSLQAMVSEASKLNSMHIPYVWGGGHGATFETNPSGLDCSGTVSEVLGAGGLLSAPETSGALAGWGTSGSSPALTVYANAEHTFMKLNGQYFGTSTTNPGGGPGWIPSSNFSSGYLSSFQKRTMPTTGSAVGGGLVAAGAGGIAPNIALRGGASTLGGVPGRIQSRGQNAIAAALSKNLNKHAAARGGGGGGMVGTGGGPVIAQIGRGLLSNGLNKIGAAGIIGNALQESGWNPASVGSGGGGLWGFTSSPYSLADLQSYAGQQGRPWTEAGLQTQFLLKFLDGGMKSALNSQKSPGGAAAYFMNNWERPAVATENQARREEGARIAYSKGYSTGGRMPSFAGWFKDGGSFTTNGPTVFGAGEGGRREDVSISPAGTGGKKATVKIGELHVHNHRPGDVTRQVKEEVGRAFAELSDELNVDFDDEGAFA